MKLYSTVVAMLIALNAHAEKYMIYWDGDPNITNYSIEQSNIETGFGTMKRFGSVKEGTQEYTVDLANGLSYTIKIRGYDNFGNVVESNTLVIKTKKDKPAPRVKPLFIKARKVEETLDELPVINLPAGPKRRD